MTHTVITVICYLLKTSRGTGLHYS